MHINFRNSWLEIRYNRGNKKFFYSKLINGFVLHYSIITLIGKY